MAITPLSTLQTIALTFVMGMNVVFSLRLRRGVQVIIVILRMVGRVGMAWRIRMQRVGILRAISQVNGGLELDSFRFDGYVFDC